MEQLQRELDVQLRLRKAEQSDRARNVLNREKKVYSPAYRDLQDASVHGKTAKTLAHRKHYESSVHEAGNCFDEPCSKKGRGILEVPVFEGWRPHVPREVALNPQYREMDQKMTALIQQDRSIETDLRSVENRLRKATDPEQKSQLQMEVVHRKTKLYHLEHKAAILHYKMKSYALHFVPQSSDMSRAGQE